MLKARKMVPLMGATAALTVATAPLTANALLSDNVHNTAGGGANIHTNEQCVDNIGDKAHVKYMVQHQPLATSSDHGQTSASGTLAVPADMDNVKIRVKAVGYVNPKEEKNSVKADVFDKPIDVPVEEEQNPKNFKMIYDDDSNPISGEKSVKQNIKDGAVMVKHHMADRGESGDASFPFGTQGSSDPVWYGDNTEDYDFYEFGNLYTPITFEVEGDITTTGKDTFATAAVSNLGWKSSQDETAGSYEDGDQSLMEYQWGRPGALPPAMPEDEEMIGAFKDGLQDAGLDITPYIAPTSEIPGDGKYRMIGSDIRQSARGDAGENYTRTFTLHANKAVTYIGQVPGSAEDGADITAAHVTICNEDEDKETQVDSAMPQNEKVDEQPAGDKESVPEKSTTPNEGTTPNERKQEESVDNTPTADKSTPAPSAESTTEPNAEEDTTPAERSQNKDNINVTTSTQTPAPANNSNGSGGNPQTSGETTNHNENTALPTTGANFRWAGGLAAIIAFAGGALLLHARKKNA